MKRASLVSLLIALVLGGVTAGVKLVYDVVPNHMAENNRNEPLFLRGRSECRHDCGACDKGDTFRDGNADLKTDNPRVFETFNAEFITLRDDYAVGSSLELGAWDPRDAVALAHRPAQNQWNGSIDVPADQDTLWKCIERNNDASHAVRWQPGPNVSFTSGTESETRGTF